MQPIEQIRRQKPSKAVLYQLVLKKADGRQATLPLEGHFYQLAASAPQLAAGSYAILYFDIQSKLLPVAGARVTYAHYHSAPPASSELPLLEEEGSVAPVPASPNKSQQLRRRERPTAASETVEREWTASDWKKAMASAERDPKSQDEDEDEDEDEDDPDDQDDQDGAGDEDEEEEEDEDKDKDLNEDEGADEVSNKRKEKRRRLAAKREADDVKEDIEMIRLQQEVQEKNTRLLRDTLTNKEVADVHALGGVQRREMVESQRMTTLAMRREWDTLAKGRELMLDGITQLDSTLRLTISTFELVQKKAQAQLTAPQPVPTDWGPVISTSIQSLAGIVRQLLPGNRDGKALEPASQANQIAAPSKPTPASKDEPVIAGVETAPAPAPAPAPKAEAVPQPPDPSNASPSVSEQKLEKLMRSFHEIGDAELFRRMTSPEGLVQLLVDVDRTMRGHDGD